MTRPWKKSGRKQDWNPGSPAREADVLTTRPTRRSVSSGRENCFGAHVRYSRSGRPTFIRLGCAISVCAIYYQINDQKIKLASSLKVHTLLNIFMKKKRKKKSENVKKVEIYNSGPKSSICCYTELLLLFLLLLLLFVGCLTSQQYASVSQGRICTDNVHVLPHRDRSCRSDFLPHSVTVYWHLADPRHLAG